MPRLLAWQKRRDFLRELEILALVGLAAVMLGTGFGVADLLNGSPISFEEPAAPSDWPFVARNVDIAHPTVHQRVLFGLTQAPTALVLIAFLALLVRTLHRARTVDPFTTQTVRNLRVIGLLLLPGLSATLLEAWAQLALASTVTPERGAVEAQLPIPWLFGGFLCFALAEMVNRARIMRDELASVI